MQQVLWSILSIVLGDKSLAGGRRALSRESESELELELSLELGGCTSVTRNWLKSSANARLPTSVEIVEFCAVVALFDESTDGFCEKIDEKLLELYSLLLHVVY